MKNIVFLFGLALTASFSTGASIPEDQNRILDGDIAVERQFNYAVSLQNIPQATPLPDTRGHMCGGVLITLQHVLTAASCVITNGVFRPINRVFAGAVQLNADTQPDRIRSIANITIHPTYSETTNQNNIAIITLLTPFVASNEIQPIALPAQNSVVGDSTLCEVAGWGGQTVGANATAHMRFMRKTVTNQNVCAMSQASLNIVPTMMCASAFQTMSAGCLGDAGNALVCPNRVLTGIQIQNNGCIFTVVPEVYTRVSNYTAWIRTVTGGASAFQPSIAILAMFALVQIATVKIIS